MAASFYMKYIAADALHTALEAVGARVTSFVINTTAAGGIYTSLEDSYVDHTYTFYSEEKLEGLRAERERIIVDFLNLVEGSYSDRNGNSITLHGKLHGVKYRLLVGEALCERVEVGEKTVEKIDPDYLAEAPKVTVTEKVYEWRCSDDILGSMAHKQVADA